MSLRQVLTIYNAERQLNEDDTALLNTLRRFTEPERALLIEQLSDKPQKKPGKKGVGKSASKSARASSLQQQISGRAQSAIRPSTEVTDDNGSNSSDVRCQFTRADGRPCHLLPDHNIHHLATANEFHEFQPPQQAQAAVGSGD